MVLAKLKTRSLLFTRRADCTKYGYDNASNRNNSSQSINTGNRLASDATYNYTYDDEGNLATKVSIASPTVTWTYSWDVNNRLTSIDKAGGGNSLYNISYKYDVFGSRIEQVEDADGAGGGASATTRFAVEGTKVMQDAWGNRITPVGTENWNVWADLNGSNALQVRYVRGDATDELFSRVKSDGTVASYLTDRMGSVRQMVDNSGVVQDTISYDGFGNLLSESNASFGDRYKWTGREYNSSTGLQYNRARYYYGESGRWFTEDPIRIIAGDYNLNRYVLNRSTLNFDCSGLQGLGMGYYEYGMRRYKEDVENDKRRIPPVAPAPIPPGEYKVTIVLRESDVAIEVCNGWGYDTVHSYITVEGVQADGKVFSPHEYGKNVLENDVKGNQSRDEPGKIIVKREIEITTDKPIQLPPSKGLAQTCHNWAATAWTASTGESLGSSMFLGIWTAPIMFWKLVEIRP